MMDGVRVDPTRDLILGLIKMAEHTDEMTKRISVAHHNVDLQYYKNQKMRLKALTTELKKNIKIMIALESMGGTAEFIRKSTKQLGMTPQKAIVAIDNEIEPVIQRADAKWEHIKEQLKEQGRW